jgi:hypothetical protein
MRSFEAKARNMKTLTAALTLLTLATAGCGGDLTQTCLVQRRALGGYAVVLDRQAPATGGPTCDTVLPARIGDIYTFDKYGADQTDLNMRPLSLTARLVVTATGHEKFLTESLDTQHADLAIGKIGLTVGADGVCPVSNMSEVRQDVVFVNEDSADPPNDVPEPPNPRSIVVTSAKFLSAPQYQGSQIEVTATYTNGGCTADYKGLGITPLVQCAADDGCNPFADPANGRSAGSGINPAYPVTCNTDVAALFPTRFNPVTGGIFDPGDLAPGVCWLTKDTFPALR